MKLSFSRAISERKKWYHFAGGINPPANKARSLRSVIMETPIPEFLFFPLKQYTGPDATPVVRTGDKVLKGQLLASVVGKLGVPVHASTSGTVTEISVRAFPDQYGNESNTIRIETDAQDTWITRKPITDFQYPTIHTAESLSNSETCLLTIEMAQKHFSIL